MRKIVQGFGKKNKVKNLYHVEYTYVYDGHWWGIFRDDEEIHESSLIEYGWYRRVRFYPEKRDQYDYLHEDHEGYEVRIHPRGKRRGKNLPDSWDDYHNRSWGMRKSWKRNSKRKRQWKWE